jgi:hypothetical protein
VLAARLDALGRDRPQGCVQVELGPAGCYAFGGPRRRQDEQLQRPGAGPSCG